MKEEVRIKLCGCGKIIKGHKKRCRQCSKVINYEHSRNSPKRDPLRHEPEYLLWRKIKYKCAWKLNSKGRVLEVQKTWKEYEPFKKWLHKKGFQPGDYLFRMNRHWGYTSANTSIKKPDGSFRYKAPGLRYVPRAKKETKSMRLQRK